jgi:hypothetical protein
MNALPNSLWRWWAPIGFATLAGCATPPSPPPATASTMPPPPTVFPGAATGPGVPAPAIGFPPAPISQAPVAPGAGGLFGSGLSPALEPQRVRLRDLLKGTPVAVDATPQRQVRIAIPLKNAFDPGRSAVKPALAAVLDQLATGFKPHAASAELRIATPDDAKGTGRLARERGASVRDYLVARGVPLSRVAGVSQAEQEAVDVLISDRPTGK